MEVVAFNHFCTCWW